MRTPCDNVRWMRSPDPENDAALMRAFAGRDPRAADDLYGRFASRIYGLGIVMLGNDAAAQDLVQDTFVKLWRNADRYDTARGRLETWVLLVARSLAIDSLRRRVLESRSLQALGPPLEADPAAGPDELAATGDLAARARHAMGALSGEQRAALELAYFGGKTSAEVAELEGIPLGTAKTRIRTALLRLREALEEHRDV
jgi:RNA polymerase sigma factor (sigma-70 family)